MEIYQEPCDLLSSLVEQHMAQSIRLMIRRKPEFASFLLRQKISYMHLLALLFSVERLKDRFDSGDIVDELMNSKASVLMHTYISTKDGVANLPKKLGNQLYSEQNYKYILELIAHPDKSEVLLKLHKITPLSLLAIQSFPQELMNHKIICKVHNKEHIEGVVFLWGFIGRRDPEKLKTIANRLSTVKELQTGLASIWEGYLESLNAVLPPFDIGDKFVVLSSHEDLKDAARRFNNCLESYFRQIISGRSCILEWKGSEKVVIEVQNEGQLGWLIKEMKGVKNSLPSQPTKEKIQDELLKCGVLPEIPPILDGIMFDEDIPF